MAESHGKISGGFYIKARCVQESDIATAPPHVREIWDWFLMNASHKDRKHIKRGQLLTSYSKIIDGLSWFVGYRKCNYSKGQCETAMKYLTKHTMVTTAKTTRGMIVTILNYERFQDPKNYENHNETDNEPTREPQWHDTIDKNVNTELKEKRKKKKIQPIFETFQYPQWVDRDLFIEFCRNRHSEKSGKIKSERAINGLINKLQKLTYAGYHQEDIITEAIAGNWKSFYAPKTPVRVGDEIKPTTYAQAQDLERRQQVAAVRRYEDELKKGNDNFGTDQTQPRIERAKVD